MKWFSIKGIFREIRTIEWPKIKTVLWSTLSVLVFSMLFSSFLMGFDAVVAYVMKALGI